MVWSSAEERSRLGKEICKMLQWNWNHGADWEAGDLDKDCFSGVMGTKAYWAYIQEKIGQEKWKTANLHNALEEFSYHQYGFITVVKVYLTHHQPLASYRPFIRESRMTFYLIFVHICAFPTSQPALRQENLCFSHISILANPNE